METFFLGVTDKHAPCRRTRVRSIPSPWISSEIKQKNYSRDKKEGNENEKQNGGLAKL